MFKRLFLACAIAIASGVLTPASATTWLVGGQHFFGVDIAEAANGDTIHMVGSGTFGGGTITGGGTYTVQNAAGTILGHGTFSATSFVSFISYGSRDGAEGGQLVTNVQLVSVKGDTADGILTVNCLVGSPPPGAHEGVNLAISGGNNYNASVHGETLFVP